MKRINGGSVLILGMGVLQWAIAVPGGGVQAAAFCGDLVESGVASAVTEDEARKAAISWWSSRAGAMGRGYEIWENAKDRDVSCKRDANGTTSCIAAGRPCLPDGMLPADQPRMEL